MQERRYKVVKPGIIVGIDPDTKENGFAFLNMANKKIVLKTLSTAQVLEQLDAIQKGMSLNGYTAMVVVEAGWLNASNWHLRYGDSARIAAAKGYDVGANHQVGKVIAEYCEHNGIPYTLQKPLKKVWQTADGKISVKELQSIVGMYGNKLPKPCPQDMRDAALLAWNYADLPMIVKPMAKRKK